jgi:hypothetical protein
MTDITVHIASNDWCVHFVVTATQIPVGPWLLFDSNDEIKAKVFAWGHVAEEDLTQYEIDLRRWGIGSAHMQLTDSQLSALVARKRGWPWNGYELRLMRAVGKYPPQRLNIPVQRQKQQRAPQSESVSLERCLPMTRYQEYEPIQISGSEDDGQHAARMVARVG